MVKYIKMEENIISIIPFKGEAKTAYVVRKTHGKIYDKKI